jgi:peptidyl-dipeptidase A
MQYTSQQFIYRESPNPAFHEAVAHAVGLNVGGPVHLSKLGLLNTPISASSGNSMINIEYLLNVALDKLPFMAFSLSVEKVKELLICKSYQSISMRLSLPFLSSS